MHSTRTDDTSHPSHLLPDLLREIRVSRPALREPEYSQSLLAYTERLERYGWDCPSLLDAAVRRVVREYQLAALRELARQEAGE